MAEAAVQQPALTVGFRRADLALAVGVVGLVLLMILPLPRVVLDLLLALSLSLSLVILFVSMYTLRPIEFSAFPSILLLITLFRLSLNLASTRLILLHGNEGPDAAGEVIKAFGNFVVGGNYAVGLVVFVILVVINFVVITKGAGRIAEVAARFMLDAMPGKQMAIDADLNAGLIDEKEARKRRAAIAQEADFYGAMDGASKFVRGDAIAAILIIVVNVLGGLAIGILQHRLSLAVAAQNYTLLTIGEGLVAQIPALMVSTAAGLIVTRAATESHLGADVTRQILVHPQAMLGASGIILVLGLMPGLPHLAFLALAGGLAFVGYSALNAQRVPSAAPVEAPKLEPAPKTDWVTPVDLMELNVGYGLISLVDEGQGGEALKRITAIRRQMAGELGFVVPAIHIRDNLQLKPNEYAILIKGVDVARGELMLGHVLAMNPAGGLPALPGIATKEPCFGLDAMWVPEANKDRAHAAGCTVVDAPSVLATHLTEVVRGHAHELVGRQEVQALLDRFGREAPKLVEELIPTLLPLGVVVRVLANLLRERVPIRDLRTILETLADHAPGSKDPAALTESVRQALARTITKQYQVSDGLVPVIALEPALDQQLAAAVQQSAQGASLVLDPLFGQRLVLRIRRAAERAAARGYQPVVLCSPATRPHLRRLIERALPSVAVLSSSELTPQARIQAVDTVKASDADQEV